MRTPYIAGNWKMNLVPSEAVKLASDLVKELKGCNNKVTIAPNFTCLDAVSKVVKGSNVRLGAQNMATVESGAHTGETSVDMLLDLGVQTVILGHSERRAIYGESNEVINTKVKLALTKGLEVILCVGETLEEREAGKAVAVVSSQLEGGLKDISESDMANIVIAYEPVWAIGTGKTATPEDAESVHKSTRDKIASLYSDVVAQKVIIQYGGSVKPALI